MKTRKGKARAKIEGGFYFLRRFTVCAVICFAAAGCDRQPASVQPSIEFTQIPPTGEGGPRRVEPIAGRVTGGRTDRKIVLYARSGPWWIQPQSDKTMTDIKADGSWENETHLGTEYAALLVEPGYRPPLKIDQLPAVDGAVVAVKSVAGTPPDPASVEAPKFLQFSGYQWKIRTAASDRSGAILEFDPANAWTDEKGFLHLKISSRGEQWMCAEVSLTRSLGYGTYRFTVRDTSQLDPAAVLSFDTWDDLEAGQNHREMDFEITRWGDPSNKNLQYVIQPYNIGANVARFTIPPGVLTHTLRWEAGRAEFKTFRGAGDDEKAAPVAGHAFTSGVPTAGGERILINFYVFRYAKIPMQNENEVVIEKFEFLP